MALRDVKEHIKKCKKHKHHYYPAHFQKCPLCARENTKDYDYLVEYFQTISRKYVTYETNHHPIVVDENNVYDDIISGKFYPLRNGQKLALFFNQKMLERYHFDERIELLSQDKTFSKLHKYIPTPIDLIKKDGVIIGYTVKKIKHLYRLQQLLKSTHIGKQKITDKTKIIMARNIAGMFSYLEKYKIKIELNQIFMDKDLNPYIPDIIFLPSEIFNVTQMTFMKKDYLPHEYYLNQAYLSYLEKLKQIEAQKELERLKAIEEQRLKDLELIRSPLEPKPKVEKEAKIELPEQKEVTTFEFETSNQILNDQDNQELVPLAIETFDETSPQTLRFHLGIIIHYILHGTHPFKGVYKKSEHKAEFFIEHNYYLHQKLTPHADISDQAKLIELYPNYYQSLMKRTLYVSNPLKIERPSPLEWQAMLMRLSIEVKQCLTTESHYYHPSLTKCPSCALGDRPLNQDTRKFVLDYKKGLMHHLLFANQIFNYLVLSFMIVFMIYLVNSNIVSSFNDLLNLMSISEKWETLKDWIRLDQLIDFFGRAIDQIVGWFRWIFGGDS